MGIEEKKKRIRQQFFDIQLAMERMEKWIATGYNLVKCEEDSHQWKETKPTSTFDEGTRVIIIHFVCEICGVSRDEFYYFIHYKNVDNWVDMREEE